MNLRELVAEQTAAAKRTYNTLLIGLDSYAHELRGYKDMFASHEPGIYIGKSLNPAWPYCQHYAYKNEIGKWTNVERPTEKNKEDYFDYFKNLIRNYDLKIITGLSDYMSRNKIDDVQLAIEMLPLHTRAAKNTAFLSIQLSEHTQLDEKRLYENIYKYLFSYVSAFYYSVQKLNRNTKTYADTHECMSEKYHAMEYKQRQLVDSEIEEKLLPLKDVLHSIYDSCLLQDSAPYRKVTVARLGSTSVAITLGEDERILQWYDEQIAKHEPNHDGFDSFGRRFSCFGTHETRDPL